MPTTTIFTKFAINHAVIIRHSFLFDSVSEEPHHHAHGNYGKYCQHRQHDDIGGSEGKICGHKALRFLSNAATGFALSLCVLCVLIRAEQSVQVAHQYDDGNHGEGVKGNFAGDQTAQLVDHQRH